MRTVDEYMKLPYKMEIIPDTEEGGYAVSFPDLPGCLTVGDTIEEAIKNAEDAKRAWLEAAIEDGLGGVRMEYRRIKYNNSNSNRAS